MKKIFLMMTLMLSIFTLAACTKVEVEGAFDVSGSIKHDGVGIEGVQILVDGESVTLTETSGTYTITDLNGEAEISVTLDGYTAYPSSILVSYERTDADFTLVVNDPKEPEAPVIEEDPTKIEAPTDATILEEFTGGIYSDGTFQISSFKWGGSTLNKGTLPNNVGYTEDGTLILSTKGNYYPNANESNSGAAIVSTEAYGPGRYEMAAKVPARHGMMTSIWSFYYESASINHEIDIEFPPYEDMGYDYISTNTWTGLSKYTINHLEMDEKNIDPHNDGKWHVYAYEWSVKDNYVKFYIDDQLVNTITTNIPQYEMQVWIGSWMNKDYVPYEQSDMLIDWFAYTSFNETAEDGVLEAKDEYLNKKFANPMQYPTEPTTLDEINYDWMSNGNFEGSADAWMVSENSNSHTEIIPVDYLDSNRVLRVVNQSNVMQTLPYMYENSNHLYTLNGQTAIEKLADGDTVTVSLYARSYKDDEMNTLIFEKEFTSVSDYEAFTLSFTMPENSQILDIVISSTGDNTLAYFDDLYLTRSLLDE